MAWVGPLQLAAFFAFTLTRAAAQDEWAAANSTYGVETLPVLDPGQAVEIGVHFRARLVAIDPVATDADYGNSSWVLRQVRTRLADGSLVLCNDTYLPATALLNERPLEGGPRHPGDLTGGYVTFTVPDVDFRMCVVGPNVTAEVWAVVANRTLPVVGDVSASNFTDYETGDVFNVTQTTLGWSIPTGDLTAATWTALRISSLYGVLTASPSARAGDLLKIVAQGSLCTDDAVGEEAFLATGSGGVVPEHYDWGGIWYGAMAAAVCSGRSFGTEAGLAIAEGQHWEMHCRLPLPTPIGTNQFSVCYSSTWERATLPVGSPAWRYLSNASLPWGAADGSLTVSPYTHNMTWQLNDTTRGTFASLRLASQQAELNRTRCAAAPEAAMSRPAGGDQVRLLPAALFGVGEPGCFSTEPLARAADADFRLREGPSEASLLRPDPSIIPADLDMLTFADSTPTAQTEAFAFLRVPEWEGPLVVCYRPAGRNWRVVSPWLYPEAPQYNFTWELNDTSAGSYAPLSVTTATAVLSDAPPPTYGAAQIKLVLPSGSCQSTPAEGGTLVEDTGAAEIRGSKTWDATNTTVNHTTVVAYIRVPPHASRAGGGAVAYRVCFKHGHMNWRELPSVFSATPYGGYGEDDGWLLVPSPPSDLAFEVPDSRAGLWGHVLLTSLSRSLDLRPTAYTSNVLTTGTMLRLVPNTTSCVVTYPDVYSNHSSEDLGLYCVAASDPGCTDFSAGFRSTAGDLENARGGVGYFIFPDITPEAGYRVCVKIAGMNWVEPWPGQLTLEPPPGLAFSTPPSAVSGHVTVADLVWHSGPLPTVYDSVKLVAAAGNCLSGAADRGRSSSLSVTPRPGGAAVRVQLPAATAQQDYIACHRSDGYHSWTQLPGLVSVPPAPVTYSALHALIERTRVDVAFYSVSLFDTRPGRDRAWLTRRVGAATCEDGGIAAVSALGPVQETGVSLSTATFYLPGVPEVAVAEYRVCYQLDGGKVFETLESPAPPVGLLPWPGPAPVAVTGGRFVVLKSGLLGSVVDTAAIAPPGSPPRTVAAGTHVDAGFGVVTLRADLPVYPSTDAFKLVPAASDAGCEHTLLADVSTGSDLVCNDTAPYCYLLSPTLSVPTVAGTYKQCVRRLAVTPRWIEVPSEGGDLEVADTMLRFEFRDGRVYISDNAFGADHLPSPTLSATLDSAKIVNASERCGVGENPPTRLAPGPLLALECDDGVASCNSSAKVLKTPRLNMTEMHGAFRVCYRKGVQGPSAPRDVFMEIPSWSGQPLSVGPAVSLAWVNDVSPFALYNTSYLLPLQDYLDAEVEYRRADGTRADDVDGVVTASLALLDSARTAGTFQNFVGECGLSSAGTYSWPVSNGKQWARNGLVRFRLKILSDCSIGCQLNMSADGVANISDVVWANPIAPSRLVTNPHVPQLSAINPEPMVSATGVWTGFEVFGTDAAGLAAAGSLSAIRIAPNATHLGTAAQFRCRDAVTKADCGAIASPGPFPATLNGSGHVSVEVGVTGRTAVVRGNVAMDIYLHSNTNVKVSVSLGVRAMVPSKVVLVGVTRVSAEPSWLSDPPRPWEAETTLPAGPARTRPGTYLLAGVSYQIVFQLTDAQGLLCTLGDVAALAPSDSLVVGLLNSSGHSSPDMQPIDPSGSKLTAAYTADAFGRWSVSMVFPKACGEYDLAAGVDRPCTVTLRLGNTSGFVLPGSVTGTFHVYVREQAVRLAVEAPPHRPGLPGGLRAVAVSDTGARDWWFYCRAWVMSTSSPSFDGRFVAWEGEKAELTRAAQPTTLEYGAAVFQHAALTRSCSACRVDVLLTGGLPMPAPALWVGLANAATLSIELLDGTGAKRAQVDAAGRVVVAAGLWLTVRIRSLTADGNWTRGGDDTAVQVTAVQGFVADPDVQFFNESNAQPSLLHFELDGPAERAPAAGEVLFRIRFREVCIGCNITVTARTGPDWAVAGAVKNFTGSPFNIRAAAVVRRLVAVPADARIVPIAGAPAGTGDVWYEVPRNQPVVISILALDGWDELVPSADIPIQINHGSELPDIGGHGGDWKTLEGARRIVGGVFNATVSVPAACLRCWLRFSSTGLPDYEVSLTVHPMPQVLSQAAPDGDVPPAPGVLLPVAMLKVPGMGGTVGSEAAWDVVVWIGEVSGGSYVPSYHEPVDVHVELLGDALADKQLFDCHSGCSGLRQGGYTAVAEPVQRTAVEQLTLVRANRLADLGGRVGAKLTGRKPGVTGTVRIKVEFKNSAQLAGWLGERSLLVGVGWGAGDPKQVVVHDATPWSGPGALQRSGVPGVALSGSRLGPWNHTVPGRLFAGAPFPVFVEVQTADALLRAAPEAAGHFTINIRAAGCGDGTPLSWRPVLLPESGDGLETLGEWNSTVRVMGGRALVWVQFGSPCQHCQLEFTYHAAEGARMLPPATRSGRSRVLEVHQLTADRLMWSATAAELQTAVPIGVITGMPANASVALNLATVRAAGALLHLVPLTGTVAVTTAKTDGAAGLGYGGNLTVTSVSLRSGVGSFGGTFTGVCAPSCSVFAAASDAATQAAVGATPVPAPYTFRSVTAATALKVYGPQSISVTAGKSFSLTVAAVNANGERAELHGAERVEVWREDGGGNGDGGELMWTNAGMLGRPGVVSRPPAYEDGLPLASDTWLYGTQPWRFLMTEACAQCVVRMLGTLGSPTIRITSVAVATRLIVARLSSERVLLAGDPLSFRVVAADDFGNWDEALGSAAAPALLSVHLEDQSGAVVDSPAVFRDYLAPTRANSTAVGLVGGVVWVSCVFLRPAAGVTLIAEAAGLSNRLKLEAAPLPLYGGQEHSPPDVTVYTVAYGIGLLGSPPSAVPVGAAVKLVFAVVDSSPPPYGPFVVTDAAANVTVTADGCGGLPVLVTPEGPTPTTSGAAEFVVLFQAAGPSCTVRADVPAGTLQSTTAIVHIPVRTAVCDRLRIVSGARQVFAVGATAEMQLECVDAAGLLDSGAEGTVGVSGSCGLRTASATLTRGVATVQFLYDQAGVNCSAELSAAVVPTPAVVPSATVLGGLTVQRSFELRLLQHGGDLVVSGRPFGVRATLYDAGGEPVVGARAQLSISIALETNGSVPVRDAPPRLAVLTSTASTEGAWGVWVALGEVTPPGLFARLTLEAAGLQVTTPRFVCRRAAARLIRDGPVLPTHLVVGRPFSISVRATDATGDIFPEVGDQPIRASDQDGSFLVRLRELDPVELRPLRSQANLRNVKAPSERLTLHLQAGRRRWDMQWRGGDAQTVLAVVGAPMASLEMYGPLRVTMQVIHRVRLVSPPPGTKCLFGRTDCGACIGCRPPHLQPFYVQLIVEDAANNTVLGDNETVATTVWQTNEGWQKVLGAS
eukprot:TRINITY_DN26490_c0_g1_i1.p1 TRINITY_DN26490_c0_g1~~TRINITY_DN26490_c0_g1_i1.p1  ORF type:complete len:3349 (+),score=892.08 TRINITY_DN26490_c0_g1_i1:53-10099(+)